ncbi:hypothetical protein BASA81_012339 [Batrachochytrium salamandrivorans]|nr:hypothetical protein BASA81_012339 [Batrachochytrium salamandrivorans]
MASVRANKKPTDVGVLGLDATKKALNLARGPSNPLAKPKEAPASTKTSFGVETEDEIARKASSAADSRARVNDKLGMIKYVATQAVKSLLLQKLVQALVKLGGGQESFAQRLSACLVIALNLWRFAAGKKLNSQLSSGGLLWLPLLGHAIPMMLNKHRNHDFLLEVMTEQKCQSMELQLPGGNFIALMDARDREYVLRTHFRNYPKNREGDNGSFEYIFGELMGRGIFAVDGEEWRDVRKVASHMFSSTSLQGKMEQVFNKHADHFVKYLDQVASRADNVVDIQDAFQSSIFDGFCEIAFGVDAGSMDMLMQGEGKKNPFLVAFDNCQCHATERFLVLPLMWTLERYLSLITGVGSGTQYETDLKILEDYINPIIAARLADPDVTSKQDLLSLYINHGKATKQDFMLEVPFLRDTIINYMIAGRDTTSCTLSYTLKYLGENPAVHQRILDEAMISGSSEMITLEQTKTTPFTDAVINEVLRLAPPVVTELRLCVGDDVLPSGIEIKDGFRIIIPNRMIGRDEFLWKDPNVFVPERWMSYDSEGNGLPVKRPDEYVFPVFWAGKRLCLGRDMARFEAIVFMNKIFSKFNVTPLPGQSAEVVSGPVMFAKEGIKCRITRKA